MNMHRSRGVCGRLVVLLSVLATIPAAWAQETPRAPAGRTDAEKEIFLQTAEILSLEEIGIGFTGTQRATLNDGGFTHDAHIQSVDVFRRGITQLLDRVEINFRDSYKFNIAGYRLDRLLDLNVVPVSVERTVQRKPASVTWWVDDVQMMEQDRLNDGIQPPDLEAWNDQMSTSKIFTELIYNIDANAGNFLITGDWKLHLIDFTRAFRHFDTLREPENIGSRIDRSLYEGLRALDKGRLEEVMDGLLGGSEIDGILGRRDVILEILDAQIAEKGEAAVVYDVPGD